MEQRINVDDYNKIKEGFESENMGVVLDIFKKLAEQSVLEKYLELLSVDLGDDYITEKLEGVVEKLLRDVKKRIAL